MMRASSANMKDMPLMKSLMEMESFGSKMEMFIMENLRMEKRLVLESWHFQEIIPTKLTIILDNLKMAKEMARENLFGEMEQPMKVNF